MADGIGWGMQHPWKEEKCILSFGWETLRSEKDHLEHLGLDDRILLKCLLEN